MARWKMPAGAGTELDVGCEGYRELFALPLRIPSSAFGSEPPERKEGQRDRSSGREVPVDEEGDRCERIAAA